MTEQEYSALHADVRSIAVSVKDLVREQAATRAKLDQVASTQSEQITALFNGHSEHGRWLATLEAKTWTRAEQAEHEKSLDARWDELRQTVDRLRISVTRYVAIATTAFVLAQIGLTAAMKFWG